MNIHTYTGKPYDFRRYNCWHHVRQVRADAGICTPEFDVKTPSLIAGAFDRAHVDPKGLQQVSSPQNFDAVLMGERIGGRLVWHAGVYFDGFISHCALAARQVRLDSLADVKIKYSTIEFWR